MVKVNDKWFRTLVIVLPATVMALTGGVVEIPFKTMRFYPWLVSVSCLAIVCETVRWLMYRGRELGAQKGNAAKATVFVIVSGFLFTALALTASKLLRLYLAKGNVDLSVEVESVLAVNGRQITVGLWWYAVSNALINFFFLYTCYKVLFYYARLKHTEKAKELLEKEKLRAELQQLKGIVNPHFLFNNLNSLSSLIAEDPAKAEVFLNELTKVFRYLLRNNNTELTTVAAELEFIHSYYQLLQIRYGKSIHMQVQVNEAYHSLTLPPLTLQLLLENAVKHNQLMKDYPLRISVSDMPGKKLVMTNNLIPKTTAVESTGIGLQSINARYRMLHKEGVHTEKTAHEFSVVIPLVE